MASTVLDLDKGDESPELEFHDIPHSVSVEEEIDTSSFPSGKGVQTHTFNKFPNQHDSDDEDGDKADLLSGEKKSPSFWTFEYYQAFFDVDTKQVLRRIVGSMVPNPRSSFLQYHIRPNPDMYGPFWICTTLVFTTAIAGNMANYFQNSGYIHNPNEDFSWHYDFHKVTFAATAVFGYWWIIPTLLWGFLWWRGSRAGFTFLEIICVYGYSLSIYIPISILFVLPYNWLHWTLVLIGMVLSGSVLILTFWPAVRDDSKKIALIVMGFIMIFHGLLAAGFVLYFFHVPTSMAATPLIGNVTTTASQLHDNALNQRENPRMPSMASNGHNNTLVPHNPSMPLYGHNNTQQTDDSHVGDNNIQHNKKRKNRNIGTAQSDLKERSIRGLENPVNLGKRNMEGHVKSARLVNRNVGFSA